MEANNMINQKLKSRKLIAFVGMVVLVILNYVFVLGLPVDAVMSLVALTASYILGQGMVDSKQPVLPVENISSALTDIFKTELSKIPATKSLPLDEIANIFKGILATELSKINTFTIAPTAIAPVLPVSDVVTPSVTPVDPQATAQC